MTPTHYKKRALLGPILAKLAKNPDSPANFYKFAGGSGILANFVIFGKIGPKSAWGSGVQLFNFFQIFLFFFIFLF